jgi:hypothetical protein
MKKKLALSLFAISSLGLCCLLFVFYIRPLVLDIYRSLRSYNEHVTSQSDYTEITTPLSRDVINDLCSKFEISPDDPRCLADSVAYGPDFYEDIRDYFHALSPEEATKEEVQIKLGAYLESCESPDKDGNYVCWYDLRGDGIYHIVVFFNQYGYIYRFIANTSGS